MKHPLVDIGLNLSHKRFERDREAVISRAIEAGVARMILTGTTAEESASIIEVASEHPKHLFTTAGVHPHDASTWDSSTADLLRALAESSRVVAIGECGLDFNRDFSPRGAQERCFAAQLALASELGLPLFLHERDASERFLAQVDALGAALPKGVVHCFTGSRSALEAYLERGFYIGVTGWICDERRGGELQALVRHIPLDRLLVETDAPYLAPRDMKPRPKRNEPAYLPHIVRVIAGHMERSEGEVARHSTENAERLFGLSASN